MNKIKGRHCLLPLLMLLVMICTTAILIRYETRGPKAGFDGITFYDVERGLEIKPYYDSEKAEYFLFLPSYTDKEHIEIIYSGRTSILFSDGEGGCDPETLGALPYEKSIAAVIVRGDREENVTLQLWQCKNLPTVCIQTRSGTLEYVNEDKANAEEAVVEIIHPNGRIEYSGLAELSGRGNSTWWQAKKPYNLKFDNYENLFGIGDATTWCLLANYADDSQLRNDLCYFAAREVGIRYTSGLEYVSVYLNGEYHGIYSIGTKQKCLTESELDDIILFERSDDTVTWDYKTSAGSYIRFRNGAEDDLVEMVEDLEALLISGAPYDVIDASVDTDSFAKKYLIDTVLAELDNRKSQYFFVNELGKIEVICAWDYDLTLGVAWNACWDIAYNSHPGSGNPWYSRLYKYPEFQEKVLNLLTQCRAFFIEELPLYLDQRGAYIENDWSLNGLRWEASVPFWDGNTTLNHKPELVTLDDHIGYICTFLQNRVEFLEDYWKRNGEGYCSITFIAPDGDRYKICGVVNESKLADILPDGLLDQEEPDSSSCVWLTEDGVGIEDVGIVTEDMVFYGTVVNENGPVIAPESPDVEEPATTLFDKMKNNAGLLLIMGTFLILLLALIIVEVSRWPGRKAVKR